MDISQIMILICSCTSIWALASPKFKKFGFFIGLLGQPFWIYATFMSGQWGMFVASLWFTLNHIRGLVNYK